MWFVVINKKSRKRERDREKKNKIEMKSIGYNADEKRNTIYLLKLSIFKAIYLNFNWTCLQLKCEENENELLCCWVSERDKM